MGIAHPLFFSTAPGKQTLHLRITPNEEQRNLLQERWNALAEFLRGYLADVTGCKVVTWIQGSYKFGTLIRPVRVTDEFDVDLGVYICWSNAEDQFSPEALKSKIQDALIDYQKQFEEASRIAEPPKERCGRAHYKGGFHIDTPIYHLDESANYRRLATETKGWEHTDPKAIYLWFKNQAGDRDQLRRIIRYIKAWGALSFPGEKGRPSSILLTVLATESYRRLENQLREGDDSVLAQILEDIVEQLEDGRRVENPADRDEDLNRMEEGEYAAFLASLRAFAKLASRAADAETQLVAQALWADAFGYLFPGPEQLPAEAANTNLPVKLVIPNIRIRATARHGDRHINDFINEVTAIPKECTLEFEITNPEIIPPGASIEWTVRNEGDEAERANDLGHLRCRGQAIGTHERTAYRGTHYMDCTIRQRGQIIGGRRVRVHIQAHSYPSRNQPRPSYVSFRR
jgi:hypothetical protein